jgi:hypothetical protein
MARPFCGGLGLAGGSACSTVSLGRIPAALDFAKPAPPRPLALCQLAVALRIFRAL